MFASRGSLGGPLGVLLGASWGPLGPSWGHLGHVGALVDCLGGLGDVAPPRLFPLARPSRPRT
eukprot:7865672-Pyramimonas_sp.AAC.1